MKWLSKVAVGGVLWLSFSALAFGDTLTITSQTQSVEDGGQFAAFLSSNPSQQLYVYCVDFQNYASFSGYAVNISVPNVNNASSVVNTRYGTTPTSDFTFDTNSLPAVQRYVLAAWLVTQYNFTSGVTTADDQIQDAIWTLLNTGSTANFPGGDAAGTGNYLTAALNWYGAETSSALSQFEGGIQIFTSTNVASTGLPARWTTGYQEMITVTTTPEPATLTMLGIGFLAFGCLRKRVKA